MYKVIDCANHTALPHQSNSCRPDKAGVSLRLPCLHSGHEMNNSSRPFQRAPNRLGLWELLSEKLEACSPQEQ